MINFFHIVRDFLKYFLLSHKTIEYAPGVGLVCGWIVTSAVVVQSNLRTAKPTSAICHLCFFQWFSLLFSLIWMITLTVSLQLLQFASSVSQAAEFSCWYFVKLIKLIRLLNNWSNYDLCRIFHYMIIKKITWNNFF